MKKHSFKKSGTNFYKKRKGGGSKAIYELYKKTDKLARESVPKSLAKDFGRPTCINSSWIQAAQ